VKRFYLALLLFSLLIPCTCMGQFKIPDAPADTARVNDYAGVLNETEKQDLEQKLHTYADSSNAKILIAIVKDLNGESAEKVAPEWAHKWNTAHKDTVSDIFILVSIDGRDMYIASGFGSLSRLSDSTLSSIIEGTILPEFKNAKYYEGLDKGTAAIFSALTPKDVAYVKKNSAADKFVEKILPAKYDKYLGGGVIAFILLVLIIRGIYKSRNRARQGGTNFNNTTTYSSSGQSNFSRNNYGNGNNGPDYDYEYVRDYNRYYGRPPESYQKFRREGIFGTISRKLDEVNDRQYLSRRRDTVGSSGAKSGFKGGFSGGGAGGSW
jgi:uncharacterized protein